MEYTFKNTLREPACTFLLNDYNMAVKVSGTEAIVPYANIISVRLVKASHRLFNMVITCSDNRQYLVSNLFVHDTGETEDRSRLYSTFVRVLHYHLKDKSRAICKSGSSRKKLTRLGIAMVTLSFVFCFVMDYFGLNFFNPYLEATVLSIVLISILGIVYSRQLPKDYAADDIPLRLLPA